MAGKKIILGVRIANRMESVSEVQKILTEYGCNIKTRLGLHDIDEGGSAGTCCSSSCSSSSVGGGLLLLEMRGGENDIVTLEGKLGKVAGVVVKKMVFEG